jgi:chromate reductase
MKITIVSGTNRPGSQTRRVAELYKNKFQKQRAELSVELLDLVELPPSLFLPQAYEKKPAEFRRFSDSVLSSSGLFIVSPEYNGSFPGVLKLFIDMLPFPESFEKRPVAFAGLAAGQWGALRSIEQLQGIFGYRNAFIFPERIFLPKVDSVLSADGEIQNPVIAKLMDSQVQNFCAFVERLKG